MTFDEAISLLERIKDTAIGSPIKGKPIQSLLSPQPAGRKCIYL